MPPRQRNISENEPRKWTRWTEHEHRTLLRLRDEDSEISFREFHQKYQIHFPDRSVGALAQQYKILKDQERGEDTTKRRIIILKLPKRPPAPTDTMAHTGPSKQPRLGDRPDGGMDCDAPRNVGQIQPRPALYPQYTAPQASTMISSQYTFQRAHAPGIHPFQPGPPPDLYTPVGPRTGQVTQYPHNAPGFIPANAHISNQSDIAISGTGFNNNPSPHVPPPAPNQDTQQTRHATTVESTTIAESRASTEERDETSSTTDSELPHPDSLWRHDTATPEESANSPPPVCAPQPKGQTASTVQGEATPKKAETTQSEESLHPSTIQLLNGMSENESDQAILHLFARLSQIRELKRIKTEDTAVLRRRIEELEGQLTAQNKRIQRLESAANEKVAALEKRIASFVAQRSDERQRLTRVEGFVEMSRKLHHHWDAQEGQGVAAGAVPS